MNERTGIFSGSDPIEIVQRWLSEARETEPNDPDAMALSTVDESGLPDVRIVLLKQIDQDGFAFFTNYGSAKGRQIEATGKAAFVLHWKSLRRQVRVRGMIERLPAERADAYFTSRSANSRLGAWASEQSRPVASRAVLEERVEEARARHGEDPSRPPFWGGYLIRPLAIELWADGAHRLHDRFLWSRDAIRDLWAVERLYP
ncbi:pyridoxamine 5'-phosphate oxidase [Pseudoroseicyclus aestuarii]|uniref:Pyridoxine/pyridoxamine 5'-phosphate oxidase n=1 Tax=Pseudoroseicyclus aestuarii TaxID=1795041 RepID=A0A318SS91_9RHOB|nr:pyridoxamine 5'-phosphate oxidase [Pseudoroseicyclus aestuarii]PYE81389.1 pyridoxamine 5'-phosphate oxidase [Pseudoroseicyclus aestuarii]